MIAIGLVKLAETRIALDRSKRGRERGEGAQKEGLLCKRKAGKDRSRHFNQGKR